MISSESYYRLSYYLHVRFYAHFLVLKMDHSGPLFPLFSSSQYSWQNTNIFYIKALPMTGFEQRTSGVRSDRSTNWATTISLCHFLSRFDCFDSNTFRWGKLRQISFLTSLFKVKRWITLNEPWVTSVEGHGWGDHAPGIKAPGVLDYVAAHNQIRAHAKAYRLYHAEFAESQKGKVWSSKSRHLWWKITLQDQVAHPFL